MPATRASTTASEFGPVTDIDDTGVCRVPRADVSADRGVGMGISQRDQIVVSIVEIHIAVDSRLVVHDVHLGGRHAVLGEPLERVVDGEGRFRRHDDDVVSTSQLIERFDRSAIRLEDAEDARPVAAGAGPRPELVHVGEVGEQRRCIPDVDVFGEQIRSELRVVPRDPSGVEVGDHTVEVDPQPEPSVSRPVRHRAPLWQAGSMIATLLCSR